MADGKRGSEGDGDGAGDAVTKKKEAHDDISEPSLETGEEQDKEEQPETCPFCTIATHCPPSSTSIPTTTSSQTPTSPQTHTLHLHSDTQTLSLLDIQPLTPGHLLLIPRRHVPTLSHLTPAEAGSLGLWTRRLSVALSQMPGVKGYNVVSNNGTSAGQTVGHAHVHFVPRYGLDGGEKEERKKGKGEGQEGGGTGWAERIRRSNVMFARGERSELDEGGEEVERWVGRFREVLGCVVREEDEEEERMGKGKAKL